MKPLRSTPDAITLEDVPAFIPRMVMTPQLQCVMSSVIRHWKHRDRFAGLLKYGIRPIDRLLMYGPPGNGKTMACQWICRQLGCQLLRVRCDQMRGAYLGDTTKRVAAVCEFLNDRDQPAVCLFDEVESIFINRSSNAADSSCGHELSAATTVFMQAIDRWKSPTLIVMCTNLHGQIDSALTSRIDLRIEFPPPMADQALECLLFWREMLCDFGSETWGPELQTQIENGRLPESFRALQQQIATAAREWVAKDLPA
jgi:ATP-dependent 26S proteasome regulatory subunit